MKGSNSYDKYFVNPKPINESIYNALYTDKYFSHDLFLKENGLVKNNWIMIIRPILELECVEYRAYLKRKKLEEKKKPIEKEPCLEDYFIEYVERIQKLVSQVEETFKHKVHLFSDLQFEDWFKDSLEDFTGHQNWRKAL